MCEMSGAAGDGPIANDSGDLRRDFDVQLFAETNRCQKLRVCLAPELVAHLARAEGVDTEVLGDASTGHGCAIAVWRSAVRGGRAVSSSGTRGNLAIHFLTGMV